MEVAQLLVNGSPACEECAALLEEADIEFQRIPANGHTMPVFILRNVVCSGIGQIRLFLRLWSMQKEEDESIPSR